MLNVKILSIRSILTFDLLLYIHEHLHLYPVSIFFPRPTSILPYLFDDLCICYRDILLNIETFLI